MDIREFKSLLKPYRAIIGFDYGSKRLGIAVSDLLLMTATPYKILQRTSLSKDFEDIQKIIHEKEVGAMVFGLPVQMNGEEGAIAAEVRDFADKLGQVVSLTCFFWDERLSSSAVENFLIKDVDLSRAKRKKVLDAGAAAYILQGFLDRLQLV